MNILDNYSFKTVTEVLWELLLERTKNKLCWQVTVLGRTLISRRTWNLRCLQVSSVATHRALKINICNFLLDCVSLKSRWGTTVQAVSCKVTMWFKEQMACFLKKNLPKIICHFCRRNARLRKQYLSFVEAASIVAFIFIRR